MSTAKFDRLHNRVVALEKQIAALEAEKKALEVEKKALPAEQWCVGDYVRERDCGEVYLIAETQKRLHLINVVSGGRWSDNVVDKVCDTHHHGMALTAEQCDGIAGSIGKEGFVRIGRLKDYLARAALLQGDK